VAVVSKSDLLPYVPFNLDSVRSQIASLNPGGTILVTASLTGEGIDGWLDLLRDRLATKRRVTQ
jgi:hydrogenase nickel incorporation protein HypB